MKEISRTKHSVFGEHCETITYVSEKFITPLNLVDFAFQLTSSPNFNVEIIEVKNNWDKDDWDIMFEEYYETKTDFLSSYDKIIAYCDKPYPENLRFIHIKGKFDEYDFSVGIRVDEKLVRVSTKGGFNYKEYFERLGY